MTDVFGNVHLGYLVVETQRLTDWRASAPMPSACTSTSSPATPPASASTTTSAASSSSEAPPRTSRRSAGRSTTTRLRRHPQPSDLTRPAGPRGNARGVRPTRRRTSVAVPRPEGAATEIFTTPVTTPPPGHAQHRVRHRRQWHGPRRDRVQGRSRHAAATTTPLVRRRLSDFILERIGPSTCASASCASTSGTTPSPSPGSRAGRQPGPHRHPARQRAGRRARRHGRRPRTRHGEGFKMMWSVGQHPTTGRSRSTATPRPASSSSRLEPPRRDGRSLIDLGADDLPGHLAVGHTPSARTSSTDGHGPPRLRSTRQAEITVPAA